MRNRLRRNLLTLSQIHLHKNSFYYLWVSWSSDEGTFFDCNISLFSYTCAMQFDLVIPTRGEIATLAPLITALGEQTLLPERIFLVVDKALNDEQSLVFAKEVSALANYKVVSRLTFVTTATHDFHAGRWASYVRNFWLDQVVSPYVYFLDDDNVLDPNFLEESIKEFQANDHHGTTLYSPTVGWRQTEKIQSVGMRQFHYWLGWPEPIVSGWKGKLLAGLCNLFRKTPVEKDFYLPTMIGGNSLLGKTSHFRHLRFDERMAFVFEDLDMTHRWFHHIGPILVSKNNVIHHMERDKTMLEKSFVATVDWVYEKSKNRLLFVRNNGTNRQKAQFFIFGLWVSTIWFAAMIVRKWKQKDKLMHALTRGTKDGFR